ncbi:hypothetical protein [Dysosmobacter sp. HCP28S3_G4]|uniref:hypothetical protein n=1 Tax=Dysosmobacter sp. HCP28S3_G4 TaxID=3438938 RepID=UPI003F894A45
MDFDMPVLDVKREKWYNAGNIFRYKRTIHGRGREGDHLPSGLRGEISWQKKDRRSSFMPEH